MKRLFVFTLVLFIFNNNIYVQGNNLLDRDILRDNIRNRIIRIFPTENNINNLYGLWEFDSGVMISFFGLNGNVEFFDNGTVIEYEFSIGGRFEADGRWGDLTVHSHLGDIYNFTYNISDDILTITDETYGGYNIYRRIDGNINVKPDDIIGHWVAAAAIAENWIIDMKINPDGTGRIDYFDSTTGERAHYALDEYGDIVRVLVSDFNWSLHNNMIYFTFDNLYLEETFEIIIRDNNLVMLLDDIWLSFLPAINIDNIIGCWRSVDLTDGFDDHWFFYLEINPDKTGFLSFFNIINDDYDSVFDFNWSFFNNTLNVEFIYAINPFIIDDTWKEGYLTRIKTNSLGDTILFLHIGFLWTEFYSVKPCFF